MATAIPGLKLKAQFLCGGELAIGPGKADLLEAIATTGSISAADRRLGFSYRRSWLMVDVMNRCWREPLVTTLHGGTRGGGAQLTAFGATVLARYRRIQDAISMAAELAATELGGDLLSQPQLSQKVVSAPPSPAMQDE